MVSRMFRIETGVDKERLRLLRARLRTANTDASPVLRAMRGTAAEREVPLGVWALGDDDALVGGLSGHTWAGWLHVALLWVAPGARGAGLGGRLLARAETVALAERDCRNSRLETWDFQAPSFYERQGYEVVCAIPDYPEGVTEYTLTKRLG
ncbi:GNAT family N-acetyltransferase [Streptomyces spectabilis]|uniref:GNAT family N-acetyltransferase n=1 Tax=Streptomyces spectabilis TaxID=68270 RepID=A0A516R8M8_STRST|nr:GNAT family N-acetyltransferase [Streptomyces spectabilis]QDQ12012.1 GNAT family N-acetyltransferase [Streptomyces spectabilis]